MSSTAQIANLSDADTAFARGEYDRKNGITFRTAGPDGVTGERFYSSRTGAQQTVCANYAAGWDAMDKAVRS